MAKRAGFLIIRSQVAEDQKRLSFGGNPGSLQHWPAFAQDDVAALWGARIAVISAFPSRESGFRLLAFHQVDDELAVRIARQGEGF